MTYWNAAIRCFFLQNDRIIQSMDSPSSISKRFTISCLLSDETIRLHRISTESSIRLKRNLQNWTGKFIPTPYHLIVCNMTCKSFIGKLTITCLIAKEDPCGCKPLPCHRSPLVHCLVGCYIWWKIKIISITWILTVSQIRFFYSCDDKAPGLERKISQSNMEIMIKS